MSQKNQHSLQLYKKIPVKKYLHHPFLQEKEIKLEVFCIPQPTPSFRGKTFPFKKKTLVKKQTVKKKKAYAYVPRHDEKLLKMRPRVVLKKINIVKIPLYKK